MPPSYGSWGLSFSLGQVTGGPGMSARLSFVFGRPGCLAASLICLTSAAGGAEPHHVTLPAGDGMRLAADYHPPPLAQRAAAPVAILLHDLDGSHADWEPLLAPLHEAGFGVLALDLRGHGDSTSTDSLNRRRNRDPALFREMQHDLRGAYDFIAEQPNLDRARFVLVGAGLGAAVALQYAAADRSVDALVCLSPPLGGVGLDADGDIAQITGRDITLVGGKVDRDALGTLQRRAPAAHVRDHSAVDARGTALLTGVKRLSEELAEHLLAAVGPPSATTVLGSINSHVFHAPDSGWVNQISPTNLRYYSSAQEAQARGLRAARSKGPRDKADARETAGR